MLTQQYKSLGETPAELEVVAREGLSGEYRPTPFPVGEATPNGGGAVEAVPKEYEIQKGDALERILREKGGMQLKDAAGFWRSLSPEELRRIGVNSENPNLIYPGQKINLDAVRDLYEAKYRAYIAEPVSGSGPKGGVPHEVTGRTAPNAEGNSTPYVEAHRAVRDEVLPVRMPRVPGGAETINPQEVGGRNSGITEERVRVDTNPDRTTARLVRETMALQGNRRLGTLTLARLNEVGPYLQNAEVSKNLAINVLNGEFKMPAGTKSPESTLFFRQIRAIHMNTKIAPYADETIGQYAARVHDVASRVMMNAQPSGGGIQEAVVPPNGPIVEKETVIIEPKNPNSPRVVTEYTDRSDTRLPAQGKSPTPDELIAKMRQEGVKEIDMFPTIKGQVVQFRELPIAQSDANLYINANRGNLNPTVRGLLESGHQPLPNESTGDYVQRGLLDMRFGRGAWDTGEKVRIPSGAKSEFPALEPRSGETAREYAARNLADRRAGRGAWDTSGNVSGVNQVEGQGNVVGNYQVVGEGNVVNGRAIGVEAYQRPSVGIPEVGMRLSIENPMDADYFNRMADGFLARQGYKLDQDAIRFINNGGSQEELIRTYLDNGIRPMTGETLGQYAERAATELRQSGRVVNSPGSMNGPGVYPNRPYGGAGGRNVPPPYQRPANIAGTVQGVANIAGVGSKTAPIVNFMRRAGL
jgi:hypothetical protein